MGERGKEEGEGEGEVRGTFMESLSEVGVSGNRGASCGKTKNKRKFLLLFVF